MIPFLAQLTVKDGELIGAGAGAYLVLKLFSEFARDFIRSRYPKLGRSATVPKTGSASVGNAMSEVRNIHQNNQAVNVAMHGQTHDGISELGRHLATHSAQEETIMTGMSKALEKNSRSTDDLRIWLAENK